MAKSPATLTLDEVNEFVDRLRATIQAAAETEAIKRAIANLGVGVAAAPKKPGRKPGPKPAAKAAPAAKKGKRTRKPGIDPAKVHAHLSDKGQKIAEIAKKMGEKDVPRVRAALLKLRDAKKAKMAGEKSKAVWTKA